MSSTTGCPQCERKVRRKVPDTGEPISLPGIRRPQGPGSSRGRAHVQTRQRQNTALVRGCDKNSQKLCILHSPSSRNFQKYPVIAKGLVLRSIGDS